MHGVVHEAVDTARFDIDDHSGDERGRRATDTTSDLDRNGVAVLAGFLRPRAMQRLLDESLGLRTHCFRADHIENVFSESPLRDHPEDHPLGFAGHSCFNVVGRDHIAPTSLLSRLYDDDALRRFFGRLLGVANLHRYQDVKGAIDITFMDEGDQLDWHFDQHQLFVSLQLQVPDRGGVLEVLPDSRPSAETAGERVRGLLSGDRREAVSVHVRAGDAVVVRGGASLHRVTAVGGPRSRIVALLCYDGASGIVGTDHQRRKRYG